MSASRRWTETGPAKRVRRARARLEIIISREVILVVRLPPLGNAVVEGVVAIPVESVVQDYESSSPEKSSS